MTQQVLGPKGSPRRRWTLLLPVIAVLVVGLFQITGAQAVHADFFELDSNTLDAGGSPNRDDWQNLYNSGGSASSHFTQCSAAVTTTCFDAFKLTPDKIGKEGDVTYFTGGGSKDRNDIDQWNWGTNDQSPDKNDITNAFASAYRNGAGQLMIYFGADRHAVNGDAQMAFWFNQAPICLAGGTPAGVTPNCPASTPNQAANPGKFVDPTTGALAHHSGGDILAVVNFNNGGNIGDAAIYRWNASTGQPDLVLTGSGIDCALIPPTPDVNFCTTSNKQNLAGEPPWPYNAKGGGTDDDYETSAFIEGGFNLGAVAGAGTCFPSFLAETRSSSGPSSGLSLDATLKDFALDRFQLCGSSLTTTPKRGDGTPLDPDSDSDGLAEISIGTGSASVADSAQLNVTGIATWSGTLSFFLCGPIATGTCDGTTNVGTQIGSTSNVHQGTSQPVLSTAATVTSVGRYCWRGVFTSGTAGVPSQTDSSTGECFEVMPVTPTLSTQAVDGQGNNISGPVPFGSTIYDKATLGSTANKPGTPIINPTTAGGPAGGSITFKLFGPSATATPTQADCDTLASGFPAAGITVTVSGNGTYGGPTSTPVVGFQPASPGFYYWKASYSGDSPNTLGTTHNDTCSNANERVEIQQVPTTTTTRQFVYPQDKAKVTAPSGTLAGNVTFKLYDTFANCTANTATGLLHTDGPHTIGGASPQFATTNNTSAAVTSNTTVFWRVTYVSTNPAQLGSSSTCVESTAVTFAGNDATITVP